MRDCEKRNRTGTCTVCTMYNMHVHSQFCIIHVCTCTCTILYHQNTAHAGLLGMEHVLLYVVSCSTSNTGAPPFKPHLLDMLYIYNRMYVYNIIYILLCTCI